MSRQSSGRGPGAAWGPVCIQRSEVDISDFQKSFPRAVQVAVDDYRRRYSGWDNNDSMLFSVARREANGNFKGLRRIARNDALHRINMKGRVGIGRAPSVFWLQGIIVGSLRIMKPPISISKGKCCLYNGCDPGALLGVHPSLDLDVQRFAGARDKVLYPRLFDIQGGPRKAKVNCANTFCRNSLAWRNLPPSAAPHHASAARSPIGAAAHCRNRNSREPERSRRGR